MASRAEDPGQTARHYDVIVVGAGMAGLRMVIELRKLGMSFLILEEGGEVGGTWYWNCYPGARTDSESWTYILNISNELNNDWTWKERYPGQTEMLDYLKHVADRFDIRKHIQFDTRVQSAEWCDSQQLWRITSVSGQSLTSRFFIPAVGVLSVGRDIPFVGAEKFRGESYVSSAWPKKHLDFTGKRIGLIGTGATGVQLLPTLAHCAASITVFQRTPNYVLPARNYPLSSYQMDEIKKNYDHVWQLARNEIFGMSIIDSKAFLKDMKDDAAIRRALDYGWEVGGFRFVFETYCDLLVSKEANTIASNYVRDKIRAIVRDEATAEILCPKDPLMAKRPPLGHSYYETFNRPNVALVDIKDNPIKEITAHGVQLTERDKRSDADVFEFDVIIYATGFDVATGPLTRLAVRGKEGRLLGEEWKAQLKTHLGLMVEGYPNMFMMAGPQVPIGNFPVLLDNTANWIGQCLAYLQKNNYHTADPSREAMDRWSKTVQEVFSATILAESAGKAASWFVGANVPENPVRPLFWFGGFPSYFEMCDAEQNAGYPSLVVS